MAGPLTQEVAKAWKRAAAVSGGYERFLVVLNAFVDATEDCQRPDGAATTGAAADDARCLVDALSFPAFRPGGASSLLVLKALKIVSRKQCNRSAVGRCR